MEVERGKNDFVHDFLHAFCAAHMMKIVVFFGAASHRLRMHSST